MNREHHKILLAIAVGWLTFMISGISSLRFDGLMRNSTVSVLCRHSAPWTLLPHARNCRKFFVCAGDGSNLYDELSCPAGYHFDATKLHCVLGNCASYSTNYLAAECSEGSVRRVRDHCTHFQRCFNDGVYVGGKCSAGYYFDASRLACVPVDVTPQHQCSCLLPEYTTIANEDNCETFYRCVKGEAILIQCPKQHYFDAKTSSCLYDSEGVCMELPTTPIVQRSARELALDECSFTGSAVAPHSTDCSQYFVCARSLVIRMNCPRGQYFDAVQRHCRLDVNNECNSNQLVAEIAQTVHEKPTKLVNIMPL